MMGEVVLFVVQEEVANCYRAAGRVATCWLCIVHIALFYLLCAVSSLPLLCRYAAVVVLLLIRLLHVQVVLPEVHRYLSLHSLVPV